MYSEEAKAEFDAFRERVSPGIDDYQVWEMVDQRSMIDNPEAIGRAING